MSKFTFIGTVPARSGSTLVVAGSHHVIGRFIAAKPHLRKAKMKVTRRGLMQSDPWLGALETDSHRADWVDHLDGRTHTIADQPLAVVELTGEPGDVVVGHPWLLHSATPNCGDQPRFMRVQRIRPASV